jgi:pimeloyl-ACP methyl ester carboxylesterase
VIGLVLLAPVTHPWPGGVGWYNPILTTPVIGPLFARTLALPLGKLLVGPGLRSVFAPQQAPENYVADAGGAMILRPAELIANAWDLVELKAFVTAQSPNYGTIRAPTAIITGDVDESVSPQIHSKAIAAMLPRAKLHLLPGIGHMVQCAAPDRVIQAIDEIASGKF